MKQWIKYAVLIFALGGLVGCGQQWTVHNVEKYEQAQKNPVQLAQYAIDEANAVVAAATETVLAYYQAGAFTRDEAIKYHGILTKAAFTVDNAEKLLVFGDVIKAKSEAELAKKIADALLAELVKYKNKEQK